MAKRLLDEKGFKYKEIDIESENISREDLYNITGGRTVPQIVIDNSSVLEVTMTCLKWTGKGNCKVV